jgi:hypothetical protein
MKANHLDKKTVLSTLWIFALLNYLYCDVMSLMDPELLRQFLAGTLNGLHVNDTFLLGGAILMEIPIAMILLSRILNHKANRLANIIAGTIMTLAQIASLFLGAPPKYYIFCSVIEIGTTIFIVWYASTWNHRQ